MANPDNHIRIARSEKLLRADAINEHNDERATAEIAANGELIITGPRYLRESLLEEIKEMRRKYNKGIHKEFGFQKEESRTVDLAEDYYAFLMWGREEGWKNFYCSRRDIGTKVLLRDDWDGPYCKQSENECGYVSCPYNKSHHLK